MDDKITSLYGSHNDAALAGVRKAAEKVASEYGDDGLAIFEQWLGNVPADSIFDTENSPEKTAGEMDSAEFDKIAEADFLGRVMYHAFKDEEKRHEKMAEYVAEEVFKSFIADCSAEEGTE